MVLAASIWYLYPPQKSINLGLDLQGGIHLMLGVEVDKYVASQTERAADDLKSGLERKGVGVKRVAREGLQHHRGRAGQRHQLERRAHGGRRVRRLRGGPA